MCHPWAEPATGHGVHAVMTECFTLPRRPAAPIAGSHDTFPVGRIFCIGRNYAAHAREMGMDAREEPFFFCKFADALVPGGGTIPYPPETANLHFEAELVVAIDKEGAAVPERDALGLVFGYATGLDMTRRDLQFAARDKGRPWDTGKNFAYSAPLAAIRPVADGGHILAGAIRLTVNGALKQDGDVGDMIWNCAETIAYISRFERLMPGDLIYTGTPAGVGAVLPGDRIDVSIDGLVPLHVTIGPAQATREALLF
jgi:fumarylpyruvate hydrolase